MDITIIRKIISKLEEADKYLKEDAEEDLRILEIRAFFIVRHQNMPYAARLQQELIRYWEPRVTDLIKNTSPYWSNQGEYKSIRDYLKIDRLGIKGWYESQKKNKLADKHFEAREHWDLRDDISNPVDDYFEDKDWENY